MADKSGDGGKDRGSGPANEELALRKQLRAHIHAVTKREPLDPKQSFLLSSGLAAAPLIPKDRLYRRLPAELRYVTEEFLMSPGGAHPSLPGKVLGSSRPDLDEAAMRDAFTLRDAKKHQQEALARAAVRAPPRGVRLPPGWDVSTHRRRLEGIALGLQERERKKKQKADRARLANVARARILAEADAERGSTCGAATDTAAQEAAIRKRVEAEALARAEEELRIRKQTELENEKRLREVAIERERQRAEAIRRREEKAERESEMLQERQSDTPKEVLHRLIAPIFQVLWDMEFASLGHSNPFRIVIDQDTCVAMGVPDYCVIIKKPMNLTYIQEKVENRAYLTLQEFFADVELLVNNCLAYNSDPRNLYHISALELRKKFRKAAKTVVKSLQQQQK
jgi:flagellar biosynthesis GTPase FlhF